MTFEWDAQKSISNRKKHGIDFKKARCLWLDDDRVEVHMTFPLEERGALIAAVEGKIWTAI
ncbi:MAG: hypothetical protein HPY67_09150 [Syntrophaceae bacterium]|nr:hypothetical protein [Syntrophaceae bacterium]